MMFKIKLNFPAADFWLQTRGSSHNVGLPKDKFDDVQGKYNVGIKILDENVNKEHVWRYVWDIYNSRHWQTYSYGTLNLQNIRVKDVHDIMDKYEPGELKDKINIDKVDEIFSNWKKQTEAVSKLFMSMPEYRRKGQNIKKFLRDL